MPHIMHVEDNAPQFIGSYSFDAYTSSNGELLNIISDSKSRRSLLLHIPKKNNDKKKNFNVIVQNMIFIKNTLISISIGN